MSKNLPEVAFESSTLAAASLKELFRNFPHQSPLVFGDNDHPHHQDDFLATTDDVFVGKLCSNLVDANLFSLFRIRADILLNVWCYRKQHLKNGTEANKLMLMGDEFYFGQNFSDSIECYTKAIRLVPHYLDQCIGYCLSRLYAKRAICFYLCRMPAEAEFDIRQCFQLDPKLAQLCLVKAEAAIRRYHDNSGQMLASIFRLKSAIVLGEMINNGGDQQQKTDTDDDMSAVIGNQINLWFDNRFRGKRHPNGAHFICTKTDIPENVVVLRETPAVIVSNQPECYCFGCHRPLVIGRHSFWPCRGCDEAIFCSAQCSQNDTIHWPECGIFGILRKLFSPLAVVLFQLYIKADCWPEYSQEDDLKQRPVLPTDADLFFTAQQKPNKANLPKRSYQHRYILAAGGGDRQLSSSQELLLAIRESADDKDDVAPRIDSKEFSLICAESVRLMFLIETAFKNKTPPPPPRTSSSMANFGTVAKQRLAAIITDMTRLYRMNIGQGYRMDGNLVVFALPVIGTCFWQSCSQPNIETVYCRQKRQFIFRTKRNVQKYEKLTVPFPDDFVATNCRCLSCIEQDIMEEKKKNNFR